MGTGPRPMWLRVVSLLAVLWNLFGLWSFTYHFTTTPEVVATWPEVQQRIADVTPGWIFVPFAIATVGGTLGSLGLLLGKRWAAPVLLLSLLAIVVQFAAYYLLTPIWALTGIGGAMLPLCIAAVGLLLWLLARKMAARGWLD